MVRYIKKDEVKNVEEFGKWVKKMIGFEKNENVNAILEVYEDESFFYLISDYIKGGDLF